VTKQIADAGRILDIPLIDHLIIGNPVDDPSGKGYFSWREAGLL
jgi:DNA repair protein RadC